MAEQRMKILTGLIFCLFLASCATQPLENQMSYAQSQRELWQEKAEDGDAEAQYQLGNAFCCGKEGEFFSTKEAVKWWCKAKRQGHSGAREALVRVALDAMLIDSPTTLCSSLSSQ